MRGSGVLFAPMAPALPRPLPSAVIWDVALGGGWKNSSLQRAQSRPG